MKKLFILAFGVGAGLFLSFVISALGRDRDVSVEIQIDEGVKTAVISFRDQPVAHFLIGNDGDLGSVSISDAPNNAIVYYRFKGPAVTFDDSKNEYIFLRKSHHPNFRIEKVSGEIYELSDFSFSEKRVNSRDD